MTLPPALVHPWEAPPDTGSVTEVAPGILWARLPLPMKLDHVNVYLLDEGDRWTLIDTGLGWLFGRMLTLDHHDRPTPQHVEFRRRAGMPAELLAAYEAEKPFNFSTCVAPIPLGFRAIEEGSEIAMAGRRWTVHFGHGHAPHHATFWSDDGIVIAGDQVIPGISSNVSVYPTEPEADPLGDWLESCARLRTHARPDHLVLPGHKLPFRGLAFRLTQLIENHEHALDRIEAQMARGPVTAAQTFAAIFKREIGVAEYGLALGEAVAHMNHLARSGRALRAPGPGGAWHYTLPG